MCVFQLLYWLAIPLSSSLRAYSLRHNNSKIRPVNNPTMASKCSSERKSQLMGQTSLLSFFGSKESVQRVLAKWFLIKVSWGHPSDLSSTGCRWRGSAWGWPWCISLWLPCPSGCVWMWGWSRLQWQSHRRDRLHKGESHRWRMLSISPRAEGTFLSYLKKLLQSPNLQQPPPWSASSHQLLIKWWSVGKTHHQQKILWFIEGSDDA